jgi:tRNA (Thr-GGU) A37 N-methylase
VLDIKPYMPELFTATDVRLPAWAAAIQRKRT